MLYKGVVFGVYGFQFYLSSIKRYKIMEENTLVKGFNSTLVQLKGKLC